MPANPIAILGLFNDAALIPYVMNRKIEKNKETSDSSLFYKSISEFPWMAEERR
jgi:hypothetical protein